jgi:hypothetical protein
MHWLIHRPPLGPGSASLALRRSRQPRMERGRSQSARCLELRPRRRRGQWPDVAPHLRRRYRPRTLTFPDGRGSQSWSYAPDGTPSQITTESSDCTAAVVNTSAYNRRRLGAINKINGSKISVSGLVGKRGELEGRAGEAKYG